MDKINLQASAPYMSEPIRNEASSPNNVAHCFDKLTESQVEKAFVRAPEKFFGREIKINVAERTLEEKSQNQIVRTAFQEELQKTFGAIFTEYLYPKENHEKMLEIGAPLTPVQAAEIKKRGEEMLEVLTEWCKGSLSDEAKKLPKPDLLDLAMIHYARKQEEKGSQEGNGITGFLPHVARAVGGGAMAAFAVATMGHLTPTDIFFLVDLLNNKKLSKGIENFITAKLLQHIEHHLEAYLKERSRSSDPLSRQEEEALRKLLTGETKSFSHESAYPSTKSGVIHTTDILIGGAAIHTPLDAVKVIFQGATFDTMAHNQLFRDGVVAVIESIQKIQEVSSKREASALELSKIKKAIDAAGKTASVIPVEQAKTQTPKNFQEERRAEMKGAPVKKESVLRPPWRRGI